MIFLNSFSLAKLALVSLSLHVGILVGYAAFSFSDVAALSVETPHPLVLHVLSPSLEKPAIADQQQDNVSVRKAMPQPPQKQSSQSLSKGRKTPRESSAPHKVSGPTQSKSSMVSLDALNTREAYMPEPLYPKTALRRQKTGLVTVVFRLDDRGRVKEMHLQESSGVIALDRAALEAVKQWRFPYAFAAHHTTITAPIRFVM